MKVPAQKDYRIVISRSHQRPRADIYLFGLRDAVPDFSIPLRLDEEEPELLLNQLLHELYDKGSYDLMVDYQGPPVLALDSNSLDFVARPEDLAFITENIRAELRSTMHQGELAGAMGFVDGIPRSATLRAKGPALVYSLEREAFEGLIDGHPRLVYHIMRTVTRTAHGAMLGLNSQVEELTNYIVKQHGRY